MIPLRELPEAEPSIQHKPRLPNIPFEDDGQPCASVGFTYPKDETDATPDAMRKDAQAAILEFLRQLTEDSTALLAGQRLHLLAYLAGVTDCRTHRELAQRLNVTPSRVTQILQSLPQELQSVARLRGRTAKRRATIE